MKPRLFVLAFTSLLISTTNAYIQLDEILSNPASVGIPGLSTAAVQQLQKLESYGGLTNCQVACLILSIIIPSNVSLSDSPTYTPIPYWSAQQQAVTPACRVDVSSAQEISTTLQISKLTSCPFAVKSGGHAAFAGGSSIQGGILINLANLNEVTLSQDRETTRIGPGNVWSDVYEVLDPLGVSVVGGREAGVGVGGLTLGGGISYFSGRYGWACDNVQNYEVILANGSIVNANTSSNPDLYWALRGGSGTNFGLVSRFDLATFEQGLLWGGSKIYAMAYNYSLADAYANFIVDAPTDNFAHLYLAFAYAEVLGGFFATTGPTYGKPVANASIFAELNKIPAIVDETGFQNMTALSVALNQTSFARNVSAAIRENLDLTREAIKADIDIHRFKTVTFKNSATLIKAVIKIFIEEATSILNVAGFAPAFAFQPLSLNIIENMSKNGGNVLGLSDVDGPLTIMNLNWGWTDASDDAVVFATVNRFVSRSVELATSMGLDNRFIYMNYASQDQNVFAGYGEDNVRRLESIQREYDPDGVFKRLQPGYFKLD